MDEGQNRQKDEILIWLYKFPKEYGIIRSINSYLAKGENFMNGEIEQMSSTVCCARKALYDNNDIEFTPGKFVLSIK